MWLPEQDLLHDVLPELVVQIQVDPDDDAGDEHDDGALDHLVLRRPLDLLQLGPRLLDEPEEAAAPALAGLDLAGRTRCRCTATLAGKASFGRHLARLPVRRVPPAPAAVLRELDAVGGVPLRLVGLVVAPLALRARERDRNSDSGLCHGEKWC